MKTFIALLVLLLSAAPASAQNFSIPVHGNWCGIAHSGGRNGDVPLLPPIDPLDAACMRHDICIGQQGRFNCGCDIGLMFELRGQAWPGTRLQTKARAIYDTIAMMPCTNANGMAIKGQMVVNDWAQGVTSGREAPWDILQRLGLLGWDSFQNGGWQR